MGFLVTDTFVVHTARIRAAEIAHEPFSHVHYEVILDQMRFFCRSCGSFAVQPL
jgi:hypothetical protein